MPAVKRFTTISIATTIRRALQAAQRSSKCTRYSIEQRRFYEGKANGLELAVPEMEMQIARVKLLTDQLRASLAENDDLRRRIKELESQA